MKFLKRGVALALLAAFALASQPAQAYEKDKTYKITILHTNDHHGHFWRSRIWRIWSGGAKNSGGQYPQSGGARGGKRPVVIRRRH